MSPVVKFGVGWILCSVAATAAGQVLPEAIQACKREPDNARRLQCYDREVAKFPVTSEQAYGLSETPAVAAQRQSPGTDSAVKNLTANIAAIRERPLAGFVVTFENGQVWQQIEMDTARPIDVGDTVTIKPGWLGSFWLVGPSGRSTRVRRLQ
jgi:hypothetical protein